MEEIWKGVLGYEGLYEVSNLGNIRSLDRMVIHKKTVDLGLKKGKKKYLTQIVMGIYALICM